MHGTFEDACVANCNAGHNTIHEDADYRNRSSLCHLELWRGLASNYSCVAKTFFCNFRLKTIAKYL